MSMEDAIKDMASAMRELSGAIKAMYAGRADALALALPPVDDERVHHRRDFGADTKADTKTEILQAVEDSGVANVVRAVSAEIEAKGTVEPDAKKGDAGAGTSAEISPANSAGSSDDVGTVDIGDAECAPLDYAKDVRPVLLQVVKGGKRAEVEAFLAKAGVKKADELPAEKLPALFDLANKLAAEIAAAKAA